MISAGIRELKNNLSRYVREIEAGKRIAVTANGRVVAELVPPAPGRGETLSDIALADAVRRGWLTPPLVGPGGAIPRKPILPLAALIDDLAADRADR